MSLKMIYWSPRSYLSEMCFSCRKYINCNLSEAREGKLFDSTIGATQIRGDHSTATKKSHNFLNNEDISILKTDLESAPQNLSISIDRKKISIKTGEHGRQTHRPNNRRHADPRGHTTGAKMSNNFLNNEDI